MLEMFRALILTLVMLAPAQVGCDMEISRATLCWVNMERGRVEYLKPSNPARIRAIIELKRMDQVRRAFDNQMSQERPTTQSKGR